MRRSTRWVFNSPIRFNFPLASGGTLPGFALTWGTDLGRRVKACSWWSTRLGLNTLQPSYPMPVHGTGFAEARPTIPASGMNGCASS